MLKCCLFTILCDKKGNIYRALRINTKVKWLSQRALIQLLKLGTELSHFFMGNTILQTKYGYSHFGI